MQGRYELLIENEDAMVALGGHLAEALGDRGIVFLHGDLGAGKTTFCRGVLRHLGHQGAVKSPTYTLVEPYEVNNHKVYHFDLYRLADPEELEFIGGRDYFSEAALCLVEWPTRGQGELPEADLDITFAYHSFDQSELPGRKARIVAVTDKGKRALKTIRALQGGG
ncbi:tRNA (adenosine(37)-N6)-threonylcarbamoyltransferase complex ATPase subunit type 1 TsaE [Endozoicomonas sp. GU-1]|uniref:tRNA (adenosine(37)-N6)-threonylcarbamoyltransferase complex ATPase subunit type 1 TsaE n=1 Tax=Endozoicomonas sp. GU-1 TaxID=3009078 RepID=UPI0022B3AC2C|nr:tRNA (adenosine(37)-N6)-threonylcarbamoyltransferase complex ATPase subunit type 1 TsaE [Endozoicomonas sp. GU-1]WBA81024.1 tRNA (adenosine(37)-N6)-threonylcarbamoyltransferase complex ATPase subunit type 1 TsaE [Endozoicomonas sp. GU-1]WBA88592.1 tRNA (adenosine(37)-N6)-threonylcarbamoyltransferase complex ATPase subunit type 1 TsaE [Endozoicomonas sp. GU-1]